MAKKNGGIFDINGDGKVDVGEAVLDCVILEEGEEVPFDFGSSHVPGSDIEGNSDSDFDADFEGNPDSDFDADFEGNPDSDFDADFEENPDNCFDEDGEFRIDFDEESDGGFDENCGDNLDDVFDEDIDFRIDFGENTENSPIEDEIHDDDSTKEGEKDGLSVDLDDDEDFSIEFDEEVDDNDNRISEFDEAEFQTDIIQKQCRTEEKDEKTIWEREDGYPNKRQAYAAKVLNHELFISYYDGSGKTEEERSVFILEKSGTIVAANYLTARGAFLFSQAVKDHFDVPVTLPDEDEEPEFSLPKIVGKIARKDIRMAIEVWVWCVDKFLPYIEYTTYDRSNLTDKVIDEAYWLSDEFKKELRIYFNEHSEFRKKIIVEAGFLPGRLDGWIVQMIIDGFTDAAVSMFEDGVAFAGNDWKSVNQLMSGIIDHAKMCRKPAVLEFVEHDILPKLKQSADGMVLDEIEIWEKDISDSVHELKYGWHKLYEHRNLCGLELTQFDTSEEFECAWRAKRDEWVQEQQDFQGREVGQQEWEKECFDDTNIYRICGVKLAFSGRPYSFRTEDESIKIGDRVVVSVGDDNKEMEGLVISVGQYTRLGAPYPVEQLKFILRKKD